MKQFLFLFLFSFASFTAFGQQYGHVNFGNLLSSMPEAKTAEKQLQTYEKEQIAKGEKMVADFQKAVSEAESGAGDMTPNQLAVVKERLTKQQQTIQQFDQQIPVLIEKKRQELLGPIIKKAKDAVEAAGKAGGYQMVFDSSIFGNILFAKDATDLMPAVKSRLGIE